jgi:hypothetical protein
LGDLQNVPLIPLRFPAENLVDTVISPDVYIMGVVCRGMNLFAGKQFSVDRRIPVYLNRLKGGLKNPVIRNRQKIKAPLPVIRGHHRRRLYAVGITGVAVHIPPVGTQFV